MFFSGFLGLSNLCRDILHHVWRGFTKSWTTSEDHLIPNVKDTHRHPNKNLQVPDVNLALHQVSRVILLIGGRWGRNPPRWGECTQCLGVSEPSGPSPARSHQTTCASRCRSWLSGSPLRIQWTEGAMIAAMDSYGYSMVFILPIEWGAMIGSTKSLPTTCSTCTPTEKTYLCRLVFNNYGGWKPKDSSCGEPPHAPQFCTVYHTNFWWVIGNGPAASLESGPCWTEFGAICWQPESRFFGAYVYGMIPHHFSNRLS